jgi:hypothetical protein
MNKPVATWCQHCDKTKGCKIYDSRPQGCADFKCMWLSTQTSDRNEGKMPEKLRPDRSKVIFMLTRMQGFDGDVICVAVDPAYPAAWKTPDIQHEISELHRWQPTLPIILSIGNTSRKLALPSNV